MLASQALQVYYVRGIKDPRWGTTIETKPRNLYEVSIDEGDPYQEEEIQYINVLFILNQDTRDIDWSQNTVDKMVVE